MKTLVWEFPLARPHAGIPLGNGLLGALVWGDDLICITLNREDFWDHRGAFLPTPEISTYENMKKHYDPDNADWTLKVFPVEPRTIASPRASRLPFGRFELELREGIRLRNGVLDLHSGRVTLSFRENGKSISSVVEFDLSVENPLIRVSDPDGLICRTGYRTAWEWVEKRLNELSFPSPQIYKNRDATGWAQECPADPAMAAICRKVGDTFLIAVERGENAEGAFQAAEIEISAALESGLSLLRKNNANWWGSYWERAVRLTLPDERMNRLHTYALYKMGAATNPASSRPAGLQGPWVEEYQWPPWAADYHFNVNVQQLYTLPLAANLPEHLMPLFDWIDANMATFRKYAEIVCNISNGVIIGMSSDDRGQLLGLGPGILIDHACTGWTAQLYWLYYQYTGDVAFLRKRAYPFMLATMRVFEAMLEEQEGRLSLAVSISAEYGNDIYPRFMGRDPSWQLACIHMLLEALSEAARILEVSPEPSWDVMQQKVPRFTTVGEPGQERIGIWKNQDLDSCHRHHSHLASIYPFDSVGEASPEKDQLIENSLDHWIEKGMGKWSEWCLPWAAILQARMGFRESPRLLLHIWQELFVNEGYAAVYLPRFRGITAHRKVDQKKPRDTNEIMQLDGTMSFATALHEMICHSTRGVTKILPAIPSDWQDLKFGNLRLPGAFLLDGEVRDGQLIYLKLHSLKGGTIELAVTGWEHFCMIHRDGIETLNLPAAIRLAEGETVRFVPA